MIRPLTCNNCAIASTSTGFVQDAVPANPKLALCLKHPGKNELIANEPITGWSMVRFQELILDTFKLTLDDILFINVLRCYPKDGAWPTGKARVLAQGYCNKTYGQALRKFNPTIIGCTYDVFDLFKDPNIEKFILASFRRALELTTAGERVLLLSGKEAKEYFLYELHGGLKKWQRTFIRKKVT